MSHILIDRIAGATRLALTSAGRLEDFSLAVDSRPSLLDGLYLARVTDVIPSISAAFLDLGGAPAMLNFRHDPPVVGALMIVQVAADAHGDKDARVVDHVALEGRFTVLRPMASGITISQAIRDRGDRARLEAALPKDIKGGITVRSRAAGLLADGRLDVMTADLARLAVLWAGALEAAERRDTPGCLVPAPTAMERAIGNWADEDTEIICADAALLKPVADALAAHAPDLALHPHFDAQPGLFARFGIEDELATLTEPVLALTGGGHISIYETPALTAVDVDSGSARSWAPDQTAEGVNAVAAEAVARQLRLRHIGGTVVVDFVGFEAQSHAALEHLRAALAGDPLASRPVGVSGHGLAILTRRRLGPSLGEHYAALRHEPSGDQDE